MHCRIPGTRSAPSTRPVSLLHPASRLQAPFIACALVAAAAIFAVQDHLLTATVCADSPRLDRPRLRTPVGAAGPRAALPDSPFWRVRGVGRSPFDHSHGACAGIARVDGSWRLDVEPTSSSSAVRSTASDFAKELARPPGLDPIEPCPIGFVALPGPAGSPAQALGDVDGDGDVDVVTVLGWQEAATLRVTLNLGDATFGPAVVYPAAGNESSIALGDLDGDGDLDAATPYYGSAVSIYMNAGDGTFLPKSDYPAGSDPWYNGVYHVAAVDVDGDHDLDLVTANWYSSEVSVLANRGDGTFVNTQNVGVPAEAYFLAPARLDSDAAPGFPDLVGAGGVFGDTLFVVRNDGRGGFSFDSSYALGYPVGAHIVAVGDVDGDGDPDAVLPLHGQDDGSIAVLLYDSSSGLFELAESHPLATDALFAALADLDADGDLDIAATARDVPAVVVLRNEGAGAFVPDGDVPLGSASWDLLLAGDVDGDCAVDLLHAGTVLLNLCPPSGPDADGDGLPDRCDPCPYLVGPCPDLNGDGVVDGGDLGLLLRAWGPCRQCPADLDGDFVVAGADLGLLLARWGELDR